MRGCASALLLVGWVALTPPASADDEPCRDDLYSGDLTVLFAPPRALGFEWESVRETPANPMEDPELRAAGVRAAKSLHYTRPRPGGSEVCSLEIWSFATGAAARRARAEIEQPAWRIDLRGNLLLMSRGVTFSREHGFRPGLLPECHRLADLTESGASGLLGCSAGSE